MTDALEHAPVQVRVVQDDTKKPEKSPNLVGTPRVINVRPLSFGDGPVPVLAHNLNRVRAYMAPLYGAANGIVWIGSSPSDTQDYVAYPLVSLGTPAGDADHLESFATTELYAIADPGNTTVIQLRVWTEVRS